MSIPNEYWDLVDNISGMKGTEKHVLTFLCRKANPKQNYSSWYSVSEMARINCISVASVKNATKALSDMGLITKKRIKDSSSIYTLNLERISQLGRDNICLNQKEEETANPTENPKQDVGRANNYPSFSQILAEGELNNSYKNVNEDVNTGGTGVRKKVTHENLSDEIIAFWKAIRIHVRDLYQVERFPSRPSQEDIDAMEWAIDEMLPNGVSDNDCRLLCIYVDDELGEPHSVLNPIVRLRLAYGAHEWPEMRFGEKFWQYMEDYNPD
ncbi:hypothetical protein [Vibrio proteolyticus]|uniref:Helix-turn-helix domain-containing protein n=1 Tax=Vibrio proteolyticus NBRC 13287 TaxID=1219065 RepID=U3A6B4_VIBPR|nr:hypothetical protein [Vibrio proteolyticus]GAD68842.1 hypothetical protein VPR01S_20_00220 [Vibrio proteolyticus NBRC 13287]